MKPTLLLGDSPRIVVPAARSLWRHGIPVVVCGFGNSAPSLRSRAVKRFHNLTAQGEAQSTDILQKVIDDDQPDWLLPASDTALLFVADHYDRLSSLIRIGCADPAAILTVLDKERTIEAARECNIAVPRTHRIPTLDQLHEERRRLRFPVIAKPWRKRSQASVNIRYYRGWPELEKEFLRDPGFGRKYMLQEYEHGEGIGIEVLMVGGSPQAVFAHRRIQEYPSTGGVSAVAGSEEPDPDLVRSSVALLRHIGWEGLAMVEYRYERRTGRATLMEVNGRLWGSLGLSIAAGIDFPFLAWTAAHGGKAAPASYRRGVRARWTAGVVLRLFELFVNPGSDGMPRPSASRELVSSLNVIGPSVHDMLWAWNDPWPAIFDLLSAYRQVSSQTARSVIRSILPEKVLTGLQTWRSLTPGTVWIYAQRKLIRMLRPGSPDLPEHAQSVLCVCYGNIIRSPFAAAQFGRAGIRAASAGLNARPGRYADSRAIQIAPEFGVSLATHEASVLTDVMIEEADVIFVMDAVNEAQLLSRYPKAKKKLRLLGGFFTSRLAGGEIPDPYAGDDHTIRRCYEVIVCCVEQISRRIGIAEHVSVGAGRT